MNKTFRPWDVEQRHLFPPSVRDFVPEGHLAHFVREMVLEDLDLSAILASYTEARGYPPYHPAMMTALLLYGYCQGIYSSRRLEKACEERVDFMAVTGMAKPDHSRINEFRRRHREALKGLFVQVLGLCREAGLAKLGHVSLDGTKVKANASRHAAMSYGRMLEGEKKLKEEVEGWLREADATDDREDKEHGRARRGDEMPEWVKNKQRKLEKIREAKARLEAAAREKAEEGARERTAKEKERGGSPPGPTPPPPEESRPDEKEQSNFTDPESRILKTRDGYVQGYNGQAAVDAESQVIVAQGVEAKQNDYGELEPMMDAIRENTGEYPKEASADAGYISEANVLALEKRGIKGYIATGRQKHGTASATKAHRGPPESPVLRRMWARLKRGGWKSRYRLRKQTVEPVFGQVKEARGFRHFLTRGLDMVRLEWSLVTTAHNVLKLAAAR
jgi:transposase